MRQRGRWDLVLKLNFEKAYDVVSSEFLDMYWLERMLGLDGYCK